MAKANLPTYEEVERMNEEFGRNSVPDETPKLIKAALNRQRQAHEAAMAERKAEAKRDMVASCVILAAVTAINVGFWMLIGYNAPGIAAEVVSAGIAGLNVGRYAA